MTLPSKQLSEIRADLAALHQAASGIEGWNGKQGWEFITVGEYGLALDEIAYAYVDGGTEMPTALFNIFEKLANTMELESDPEYEGVARLRASANGHSV